MASSSQQYIKLKHEEHVLKRPDTYVGSTEPMTEDCYVIDNGDTPRMIQKELCKVPGEYKIFDEIIVNAHDQWVRMTESIKKSPELCPVKNIKVNFSKETGEISVYNDGEGIPVTIHETEKVYIPEMIFGSLLTSSNYNDSDLKHVGGKNGYGAKLTNIFSLQFQIETNDRVHGAKFSQVFYDNMKRRDKPKVTKSKTKPFTRISYIPDYKRFKKEGLTDDMIAIITKRTYDLAACTAGQCNVFLNDQKINIRSFEKYIDYFVGPASQTPRAFESVSDRWEVGVCLNDTLTFTQISFVNGILTSRGGKHVEYLANQISKKLAEVILKKKKKTVKPNFIKENLMLFVKCTIDNPSFNSQTKEYLDTIASKFGSKCDLSKKFIEQAAKCGIMERALELSNVKDNKDLKKTDGRKMNHLRGIPKLEDANWAGTKKSSECTLILTEGDSAKAMAMAGISNVGRDRFGIFPLRGKLINVRDEKNMKKLLENKEVNAIKKIIGLQTSKVYKNTDDLRYGHVLLLTDQDEDGSHIKGLLFNLFERLWPSLFYMDGFIQGMLTPVVKAKKGSHTNIFYSVKDYEKWIEENNTKGWHSKYYKGLGTSTPAEAKEYFKNPKIVTYEAEEKRDSKAMELAFDKAQGSTDKRKEWLNNYNRDDTLDYANMNIHVEEFVNKDLIHFSNSDNIRSIPHLCDGLKPSQRKVLFCCFKRNLVKEIRVAQLAGYVSEHGAYHHGEASLQGTIVNMAQDYVGSNNVHLLEPVGQFGSRIEGGKDSAQPRYIHTHLSPITTKLYDKRDEPLLKYLEDDGQCVEPEYYMPILPMILINGASGIGTGWSTDVPCYNPKNIMDNMLRYLNSEELEPMKPWYRGFKGRIIQTSPTSFVSKGIFKIVGDTVEITELPVHVWTDKYKEFLENIIIETSKSDDKKKKLNLIRYYDSYCSDTRIHFNLYFPKGELAKAKWKKIVDEDTQITYLEKTLKLVSSISTNNMNYYSVDGKITRSTDPNDILRQYMQERMKKYTERKAYILKHLSQECLILKNKIRFINETIDHTIKIYRVAKKDIEEQLKKRNYITCDNSYDYLLRMPIYSLTKEKIDELNAKHKNMMDQMNTLKNKDNSELLYDDMKNVHKDLMDMLVLPEEDEVNTKVSKVKKVIKKQKQ